jgi:hypothetical protein
MEREHIAALEAAIKLFKESLLVQADKFIEMYAQEFMDYLKEFPEVVESSVHCPSDLAEEMDYLFFLDNSK